MERVNICERELVMSLADHVLVCHAGFFQWVTVS